ncbi:MAG TPA: DUF4177 domain-containing protein [Burkholderiales bacterium]|nr:DUF4177 domain-containing protein [Burkholderiales bacterium]
MTERKETPDILGAILSGATPPGQPSAPPPVAVPPVVPAAPPPVARAERAARASAARQASWEYLIVSFHEQNGWHARFVNGRELENWQRGPQLHDVLDQLGADGWELINVVKSEALYGTMDRIQAFFKRVKT